MNLRSCGPVAPRSIPPSYGPFACGAAPGSPSRSGPSRLARGRSGRGGRGSTRGRNGAPAGRAAPGAGLKSGFRLAAAGGRGSRENANGCAASPRGGISGGEASSDDAREDANSDIPGADVRSDGSDGCSACRYAGCAEAGANAETSGAEWGRSPAVGRRSTSGAGRRSIGDSGRQRSRPERAWRGEP